MTVPVLTTVAPTYSVRHRARSGGTITDAGGLSILAKGVCWNTVGTPTTADSKTNDGTGTGAFESEITALQPNTIYYVRAYATNADGTGYGSEQTYQKADTLRRPTLSVLIGGRDIGDIYDYDACHEAWSERGEASGVAEIPVSHVNEVPFNGIEEGAAFVVDRGSREPWTGKIVKVTKPTRDNLRWVIEAAGGWSEYSRCTAFCMGLVEGRYDQWIQYPDDIARSELPLKVATVLSLDTDGQVMFTMPKGSSINTDQGLCVYFWPLNGMRGDCYIKAVDYDVKCGGDAWLALVAEVDDTASPFDPSELDYGFQLDFNNVLSQSSDNTDGTDDLSYAAYDFTHARLACRGSSNMGSTKSTTEDYIQIKGLRMYLGLTSAPTLDEIVAAVDADARPDGLTPETETVGAAQTQCMCDPFSTASQFISETLTKTAYPPLCGVWANRLKIKNRPTAPDGTQKHWIVGDESEWGVGINHEASYDYICVSFNIQGDSTYPDGTQRLAWYPSEPASPSSEKVLLVDAGDRTAAEAALYGQQAYYWFHELPQGAIVVPNVVRDSNGAEYPCSAIRPWDFISYRGSLDEATAGPVLISDVDHSATMADGELATVTVGDLDAYEFSGSESVAQQKDFRAGHWVATKRWERSKTKKRPKGKRWKRYKGGWRRRKLRWVEGKYV